MIPKSRGPQFALLSGASLLIFLAMTASFAPTPLYPVYQALWHLNELQIAISFAAYPAGVLAILFFLGGLSDRFGRRKILLVGLTVLAAAFIVLSLAPSWWVLTLGRVMQGFGSGLVTGAGASALVEAHPGGLKAGSRLNTIAIAMGMAVGPLLSGVLSKITDYPLLFPYLVVTVALIFPLVLLVRAPRIIQPKVRLGIIRPIKLPRKLLVPFSIAAASIATANICMSLFGSFGAQIAETVGWTSQNGTGWLVSLMLIFMAFAQIAGRRLGQATVMTIGTVGSSLGLVFLLLGSTTASIPAVIASAAFIGLMSGFALLGSAGYIAEISPPDRRAEVYSAYLVVAFVTLGAIALGAGPLIAARSILFVLFLAAVLTACFSTWVLFQVTSNKRRTKG